MSVSGSGISVTLGGKVGAPTLTGNVTPATYTSTTKKWTNDSYFATASDIATAITDAVGAIVIPTLSTTSTGVGLSASGHTVNVSTANYVPASGDTAATWTNKGYLVTGSTVETFVGAETAKTLEAAKAYSNSLHTTSVTYYVTDTLPTVPSGEEEQYKGRIYLVLTGVDGVVAADGSRIEYMYVQENGVWGWEQIGTTTADLSGYAKTVTINGQTYNVTTNTVALGTGFANKVATGQATALANQGSVYANIAENGTLTLGVASATESVMGVSKMFTGDLSHTSSTTDATDTAVSVKSAQAMYSTLAALANSHVTSVGTSLTDTVLTGFDLSVSTNSTNQVEISVKDTTIKSGHLPASTKVVANGFIDGATDAEPIAIETEKINFGEGNIPHPHDFISPATQLTTWVGDMPNLQSGYSMFANSNNLESFCGDLSAMTTGTNMFLGCSKLTSFCGDLSSLKVGLAMFDDCKLDAESLECIAETLPTVTGNPSIDIGYGSLATAAEAAAAKTAIQAKGWNCTMEYNA